MAKHRSYSVDFKQQVAQEFLAGEMLHGLAKRHAISRNLIRVRVEKYEAGGFDENARAADLIQEYEARIAALERLVGKQALELEFLKGALRQGQRPRSEPMPRALTVAEGCRLMGIARSTFYSAPAAAADYTALVEAMHAIKTEFEAYGWRRMQAALRQQGWVVNRKKVKRLMREHGLQPPLRRRYTVTTDSTTSRSSPIAPASSLSTDPTSCGWRTSPTSMCHRASSMLALIMDPGHAGSSAMPSAGGSTAA